MDLKDGYAFRFGRVSSHHRPYPGGVEKVLYLAWGDASRCRLAKCAREGPGHMLGPALDLGLAPSSGGAVLLGETYQLKPESLALEDSQQQLGVIGWRRRFTAENRSISGRRSRTISSNSSNNSLMISAA